MTHLQPSMRLKVKRDTFFLPDPNGGVYFRNNTGSFRMEGKSIHMWIENLMPAFDGNHTLDDLMDGLPEPYQTKIHEIAQVLYQNGFIRDVSQDRPHLLTPELLTQHAAQIEFIDHFTDSGAFRFQTFRNTQVLAVGSGPFLVSLCSALLDAGMPKLNVLITSEQPTHRQRLTDLVAHKQKTDHVVTLREIARVAPEAGATELAGLPGQDDGAAWREVIRPFHSVLYVSQTGDVEVLRALHKACKQERKAFAPAIFAEQVGLVGPLVRPEAEGCWESAWRRIHKSAIRKEPQVHTVSTTAVALMANVLVFDWFQWVVGIDEPDRKNAVYLLNLETMEGDWHRFLPHPLVTGDIQVHRLSHSEYRRSTETGPQRVPDPRPDPDPQCKAPSALLPFFSDLTSPITGIFHSWEEGDLSQLPLAQCRVQVANPLTAGPAELLPDVVCAAITHEEARREAGLRGLELYAAQLLERAGASVAPDTSPPASAELARGLVGIGVGQSLAEAICRGLRHCLNSTNHPLRIAAAQELGSFEEDLQRALQVLEVGQRDINVDELKLEQVLQNGPIRAVRVTVSGEGES